MCFLTFMRTIMNVVLHAGLYAIQAVNLDCRGYISNKFLFSLKLLNNKYRCPSGRFPLFVNDC